MRSVRWFAAAMMLAVASLARAQDAPPAKAKHENVVTPEAKAAMEKFRKLVHRPGEHGVSSMNGEIVAAGFPSRVRSKFEFVSPGSITATVPHGVDDEMKRLALIGNVIDYPLTTAANASNVFANGEFDADVVDKDGRQILRVTAFRDDRQVERSEFDLDANGLVVRHAWHGAPDDRRGDYTQRNVWAACGDQWCIGAVEVTFDDPNATHYACAFRYADIGGARVLSSYEMTFFAKGKEPRTFAFYVDRLTVNGKPVSLPKPWKHDNQVTAEAQAAIDRYAMVVYRPTEHGLTSLSGGIVQSGDADATPRRMAFRAGGHLEIEGAPGVDRASGRGKLGQFMLGTPFEVTLAGIPLADGDEYDAEFVERGGSRVLVVTNFEDGAKRRTDEFTFGESGCIVTLSSGSGSPTSPLTTTLRLTWEPNGEQWRIRSIDLTAAPGGGAGTMRLQYELSYAEAGGFAVVTSYGFTASGESGGQAMKKTGTFRVVDLVLNGKPVTAPPSPPDEK